jgi:large subunit ribosomal protein L5
MAKDKSEKDDKKGAKGAKDAKPAGKPPALDAKPAKEAKKPRDAKPAKPAEKEAAPTQPPRLQVQYRETIVPALMKQFGYKTSMQVPRIKKITLNMGVGEAVADKKVLDYASGDMQKIAGQRPVITKSKKSVAAFKIRDGYPVGVMVTLRNRRMYEFLDRLVTIALPRVRDFRGVSGRAFDSRGNYNMGIKEQIIFPEIEYDKIDALRGMNISITTTAKTDEEAKALLAAFKFPFRTERAV